MKPPALSGRIAGENPKGGFKWTIPVLAEKHIRSIVGGNQSLGVVL